MPIIELELKGSQIGEKRVPIDILGKYLTNFNDLLVEIIKATERIPRKSAKKRTFFEDRRLFATGFDKGSTKVILMTGTAATVDTGDSPAMKSIKIAMEGFETIQLSDKNNALADIQKMFPGTRSRIKILNSYNEFWKIKGTSLTIASSFRNVQKSVTIDQSYRPRVQEWLNKELKKTTTILKGIVAGIKAYGSDRYFTFQDELNKNIKCYYRVENESDIIGLFKTPIKLKGIISKVRDYEKIKEVLDLSKLETIQITRIDYPPLMESIELDLDYNSEWDHYTAESEEFCIKATGETLHDLKEEIILFLDVTVDMYIINKNEKTPIPTLKLKEAIERLKDIIDPNKRSYKDHWEDVSEEELYAKNSSNQNK
ncbi:MAG: hypothetical protein ACTSWY_13345 [Promethearchaeota archaeon]